MPLDGLDVFLPSIFQDLAEISKGKINTDIYAGKSTSSLFEDLVYYAFIILGYDGSEQLGYTRSGSEEGNPDGLAYTKFGSDYLLIYDAKVRQEGFRMSTHEERAIRDYIEQYRRKGVQSICFLIVSSDFYDQPYPIAGAPLSYLAAKTLQKLVSLKIQNPRMVNPHTLRELFEAGLTIDEEFLADWCQRNQIIELSVEGLLKPSISKPIVSEVPLVSLNEHLSQMTPELKNKFERIRQTILSWPKTNERITQDWTYYEYVGERTIGFVTMNTRGSTNFLRIFLKYCRVPDEKGLVSTMKYGFPYWLKLEVTSEEDYILKLIKQSYDHVKV